MNTMKICPGCQKPLEANAPDGLCPECLLKAGLGTGVDLGPDSQAESGRTSFVAPPLEEVARLFPQVEILGFIGQGGMGAVYKARQKSLDRVVALKILPPGIGKDAAFAERFTREAKALARLNHPGVVTIYEFGQADGLFFFLMEFVDGMSLRHLLEVERISAREALAIVPQICDALQYAHDQGIVHRDIKPENILLNRQGRVKVADFGLAKLVGTDAGAMPTPALSPGGGEGGTVLTEAGKVMGTPSYMAPEQSEHPSEVDHRADIYALGVVFYQMLTGELPGRPLQPPSSKVQIDVRLDEVVLRALEKKPELRYQQVSELKTRVETIAATPPAISSGRESAPTHSAGGLGSQHSVGAAPPPASQDRFWRCFALALAAVVLAPILILVGVALLGMILGVLSGARPQNQQSTHSVARSTNALPASVQTLTAPAPSARTRPAELEFRLVAPEGSAAPADLLPDPNDSSGQRQLRVLRQVVADGSDVATAGLAFERDGNRSILVNLTPSGSQRFAGVTARSVDRQLAIVFRGKLINAPVIRAPIRDGRLTITGRFSGPEVHEMVDSLNRVAQPTEETWRLSGPVEVVLPAASVTNFVLFDLDSQRWATNRMLQPDLRESRDWLRAAGVEVTALRQLLKQPVITGYDMVLAVAPSNAWDRVTAADLVQCLALADLSPRQEVNRAKDSEAVDTFFFLTREKGRGILQILGFSDDPAGVKIRYKLVQVAGTTSATSPQTNVSRTFSLRHILASEMADDLRQILLDRVGVEARPAPDNMQLTVTAPPDVLNRVSAFVTVADWPKRIAPGPDYYYPRGNVEDAARSFFYACSIEDIEGVTRMLAPGVLAELKGTNLTAHGVVGEEKDAELVRQLRGKWEGKEAAVRKVVQAWNRFPLRKLQVEGKFSRSPGPRYFASAAFEGAPVEWVELGFVPDRSLETRSRPHFGPEGPLLMDTLPPWFGEKEAGLKSSLPSPDATVGGDARAGDTAAAQVARLKLEAAQAALARAKASYDAGTASATEYRAARLAKDIAEGELRGNTAAILGARLQFAEEEYVQAETKDKAGLATIGELDKAKLAKEVAEANLAGDPVAAARAELQFAEGELRRAQMLLEVGKVTRAEVEKARAARDIAAAELSRESGRAVKPGADGGGDERGRPGLKASQPVPDKAASTNSGASKSVGRGPGP